MSIEKAVSALVLTFSMAAASAGCAGNNPGATPAPAPDRAMNRMDFDCKTIPITYVNEAENCLASVLAAEASFDQRLTRSLGSPNDVNIDYEKMGAIYKAAGSQYCIDANVAREVWSNVLAGSRSGGGYIRNDRDLYGSMIRSFTLSAQCYEDYKRVFIEIRDPALEAEAASRARQAQSIATTLGARFRR